MLKSFTLSIFLSGCLALLHVVGQQMPAAPSAPPEQPAVPAVASALAPAAFEGRAGGHAGELGPIPRVCVAPPLLKVIETSQSSNTADAIRNALVSFMNGPSVEVIPLESRIQVHIEAEAKSKSCNQVLYSTLTMQKSGGTARIGSTLKKIAPAAGLIALAGSQSSNVVATMARVAAEVLGEITVDRKKKDKVVYEYKLVPVGGDLPVVADTERYKSEEDSEDLISPMLAKNAEVLVIAAMRHHNLELARRKQNAQPAKPAAAGPDVQAAQMKAADMNEGQR
ncbi:MAG TPA: hypothetical protein VN228_00520 [Pyrinomonadaceae bacterium]|nr:hypothetical protein [Pyrinomonadaceae bacterium]